MESHIDASDPKPNDLHQRLVILLFIISITNKIFLVVLFLLLEFLANCDYLYYNYLVW